jgi:hypothetical protein
MLQQAPEFFQLLTDALEKGEDGIGFGSGLGIAHATKRNTDRAGRQSSQRYFRGQRDRWMR